MVIDGKPVRLVLQGDRIEAAKWIPYFAGLCRNMAHAHEKQTASREGMRGWAKNLGGQAFEIYVEVLGGLCYYDVSGYWMGNTPATHHVDFLAWKIPDAKLDMASVTLDPVTGEESRGTGVRIGPYKIMNGYYSEYNNSVVRIGKDLFTCYAGESADVFGVLLFKSKDVANDQKAEDVSVLLEIGNLPSNRHAIWAKDVLFLRDAEINGIPKDFSQCGRARFYRVQHTATESAAVGDVTADWTTVPLVDYDAVRANGGWLAALTMKRGRSVITDGAKQRIAYLGFFEAYETPDVIYRCVYRIDADSGEVLASNKIQLPNSTDSNERRIVGLITSYISWEGEFGNYFAFSIGTVTGVSEAMRVQTYDLWVLDKQSLAVLAMYPNCGIAQLGAYDSRCWAMDFRWADFEDSLDDPEHVRHMVIYGFMQQMAIDNSYGVPVFTQFKDLATYPRGIVLDGGNYNDRGQLEEGCSFIERYND